MDVLDAVSIGTASFISRHDGDRALMGTDMQRQAVPPLNRLYHRNRHGDRAARLWTRHCRRTGRTVTAKWTARGSGDRLHKNVHLTALTSFLE